MDIVILAGGRCSEELREMSGKDFRSELEFRGKSMVQIALDAVAGMGRAVLVGGPKLEGLNQVPAGEKFIDSLRNGLGAVTAPTYLQVTADLPFLDQESIQKFLSLCKPGAAVNYPIVETRLCEASYPGMKRTSITLREGKFTGGNIALLDTEAMRRALPLLEDAYQKRKSPTKLAKLVGPGVLGRFLMSRLIPSTLNLTYLEKAVGRIIGLNVSAIVTPCPDIAADIDTAEQYRSLTN